MTHLKCSAEMSVRPEYAQAICGDKKVIRSSIHTPRTFTGQTAAKQMRCLTACDALVCLSVEGANYQPDQNGQDRFELDI